jgi:hypothetical protein
MTAATTTPLPAGLTLPEAVTFDGLHDVGLPWRLLSFTDEETQSSFALKENEVTTALIAARVGAMRALFREESEPLPVFDRAPRRFLPGGEYRERDGSIRSNPEPARPR